MTAMLAPADITAKPKTARSVRPWLLASAFLYVVSIALTRSPFLGDTIFYAEDIMNGLRLWEFAHALWRPLGYALRPVFLALVPDAVAWTPLLKITAGLYSINMLAGLAAVLLMTDLLWRTARRI